ncbi:hypothetical protein BDR26DRAFT_968237 [Obelidium mucronatum]|nr:hypothetical protein BDR26DRAFT_968237 [Obelidium mucronatum]
MRSFAVLVLSATFAAALTRCGSSWGDANANCYTTCVFPDAACPAGQQCFTDLAACAGSGAGSAAGSTAAGSGASATSGSNNNAGAQTSPVASAAAPQPTDAASQAAALFATAPACLVPCIANGTSTITASTVATLCQSQTNATSANATAAAVSSCIQTSCQAADQAAATAFLGTNAVKLTAICQSFLPANASRTTTAASASATTTAAAVGSTVQSQSSPATDTIVLSIFAALVILTGLGICFCATCLKKKQPVDEERKY